MSVRVNGIADMQGVFKYTKLDYVMNFLSALPFINAGGCGVSAYAMYLWLKKENLLTDKFKFVFLHYDYSSDNFSSNKSVLDNGNGRLYAPEHVGVRYKNKVIDCNGIIDTDNFSLFLEIPLEKAEDYLINSLNTDDWNFCFDRPKYIKVIEKELGINFRADLRREGKSWEVKK